MSVLDVFAGLVWLYVLYYWKCVLTKVLVYELFKYKYSMF